MSELKASMLLRAYQRHLLGLVPRGYISKIDGSVQALRDGDPR